MTMQEASVESSDASLEEFLEEASIWLRERAVPRAGADDGQITWGTGEFSTAVFHALSREDEHELLDEIRGWMAQKAERGYHAITWPRKYGGLGLSRRHAVGFARLEAQHEVPGSHEIIAVTTGLIAPTVQVHGTEAQKARFIGSFLQTKELCCQLFSEPGSGSDLASLSCRADRDGDDWIINGQKVWSSAAQFAQFGELIARTESSGPKHAGMTAFIVPLDTPGIEIRPIKQMSGGSSFNEVFFSDVRLSDLTRLGDVGQGWSVALTTLGFERDHSDAVSGSGQIGGSWQQLLATARALGRTHDPVVRQHLSRAFTHSRLEVLVNRRVAQLRRSGAPPGPEGSIGKLLWTQGMAQMSDTAGALLGPRLVADTGEWGTYAWAEHVLGAPGYRIAGGTDEVQRNIIAERVLGLPREPKPNPT